MHLFEPENQHNQIRGPFLERPGNLTGPKSYFEIKFSGKVCCVLTSNEVHFVSLANNFTVPFSKLLKLQNSLTGPVITGSFEKRTPDPVNHLEYLKYKLTRHKLQLSAGIRA